jgi:hypothetical protein
VTKLEGTAIKPATCLICERPECAVLSPRIEDSEWALVSAACYAAGFARLLSIIAEAPHADHCRTYSHYAPPWADDCNCWKRPFLPPEQQRPSDPAAIEKYR